MFERLIYILTAPIWVPAIIFLYLLMHVLLFCATPVYYIITGKNLYDYFGL